MITDISLEHNNTESTLISQIIEMLRLLDTLSYPEIKDTSKTKDLLQTQRYNHNRIQITYVNCVFSSIGLHTICLICVLFDKQNKK